MNVEIELRKMRFVIAVAEERNFTRAAARCHISQPALSRQISEIEVALGTPLFKRYTRGVDVTPAGQIFARGAKRTLEQGQRTVSQVQAFASRKQKPLTLGISLLADVPKLYEIIRQARHSVAHVAISVRTGYTPELLQSLHRADLDLAITDFSGRERGLRHSPLFTEPLVAAFSERYRISKNPMVRIESLLGAPLVMISKLIDPGRTLIDQVLATAGSKAFKAHDVGTVPELLDQVVLQGRVGLLRQSSMRFQRHGVIFKQLANPIQLGCALVWCADNLWPRLASFRDSLTAFAHQP